MNGPERAIAVVLGATEADAAMSGSLAAAIPGACRLRPNGMPRRPAARGIATDFASLRRWIVSETGAHITRQRGPRAPRFVASSTLPRAAVLIVPGLGAWTGMLPALLDRRPDLKAIALIDWPTAWDWPEYHDPVFVAAARHAVDLVCRLAAIVVVPEADSAERLAAAGLPRQALHVDPQPSALAGTAPSPDPVLSNVPYVVAVGPIDARSNTVMLLHLWRDAMARGHAFPKLVLAGERGAQIEEIAPLLDWNDALRPIVAEATRLPAPALRALVDNARALLVPDHAGPCVALMSDARRLGVPVIAADTPAARALGVGPLLSPIDGPGWRDAITATMSARPDVLSVALPDWAEYAARLMPMLQALR